MIRRNVLIFHQAALGDFVITWPLALACGRIFPQSRIIYVTSAEKGRLAEFALGVESADIESGFSSLWNGGNALPPAALRMLQGAHAIFSFVARDGDTWTRNTANLAPEAALSLLATSAVGENHVSRAIGEQLSASSALVGSAFGQMLDHINRRGIRPGQASRQGVLIHPGSGAERKNWPRERFFSLAERLKSKSLPVGIVLGEVEREKWGSIACKEFADVAELVETPTLVDLARKIAGCSVFVCNDSGPGHLAGILGTNTVCLFGPTSDLVRWRPLGPNVHPIRADSLESIDVDEVESAVLAGESARAAGVGG